MEKVYFETSAFNYLLKNISFESIMNTRYLQHKRGRELLVSPVTIWEVMLTEGHHDFMIFAAQNLFSEHMLATPSEIVVRYLHNAYPENQINYRIYTDLEIGDVWRRMSHDNTVTFMYDKKKLRDKTKILWKISNNLPSILKYPAITPKDILMEHIAHIVFTSYDCLLNDGFLPKSEGMKYDHEILYKLFVLFILVLFILRLDIDCDVIEQFWNDIGIDYSDPIRRLIFVFEKYPELLKRGPLMEVTIMAYHQLYLGRKNRGLIFDSLHMLYSPYVDTIISADKHFKELRSQEMHYKHKLVHVSEINLREIPFISM